MPERFDLAVDAVDRHVMAGAEDNVAIYGGNEKITYAELMALENKLVTF